MQVVSRYNNISIESLVINFRIMASGEKIQNQVNAEATNSFYIDGLFIHGAKWVEDE